MTAPERAKAGEGGCDALLRSQLEPGRLCASGQETEPLACSALRGGDRPPPRELLFSENQPPLPPLLLPQRNSSESIMNGTLDCLQDHTLNEEQGAFMFTSESVGEGHPGKAWTRAPLEVVPGRSEDVRDPALLVPASRTPSLELFKEGFKQPWSCCFSRRDRTTVCLKCYRIFCLSRGSDWKTFQPVIPPL